MGCAYSTEVCDAAVNTTATARRQRPDFICCGVCTERFDDKDRHRRDDEPVRCIACGVASEWFHRSCIPAADPRCPRCGTHALAAAAEGVDGPLLPVRPMRVPLNGVPSAFPSVTLPALPTFDPTTTEHADRRAGEGGADRQQAGEDDAVFRTLHDAGLTESMAETDRGASVTSSLSSATTTPHPIMMTTTMSTKSSILLPSSPPSNDTSSSASSSVAGTDGRDGAVTAPIVAAHRRTVSFSLPEDDRASWVCRICRRGQPHQIARRRRNAITRMTNEPRFAHASRTNTDTVRRRHCSCGPDADEAAIVSLRPCGHQFHALCLGDWLTRSIACPTCGVLPTEMPVPVLVPVGVVLPSASSVGSPSYR